MARSHQASRDPPDQRTEWYFQKCWKASFNSHARRIQLACQQHIQSAPLPGHVPDSPCVATASAFASAAGPRAGCEHAVAGLRPPYFIDRLVHVHGDVKAVQRMQCLTGFCDQHVEVGLPHVATHETRTLEELCSQCFQPLAQRLLRSPPAQPQLTPAAGVDLIEHDQRVSFFRPWPQWISSTPIVLCRREARHRTRSSDPQAEGSRS